MTEKLKYLAAAVTDQLRQDVSRNAERYRSGDFTDLMQQGEWSIELPLEVDIAAFSRLDPSGTPSAEIENSRIVWKALVGLTPALACEEGIWARLTHVECLLFARARWISLSLPDSDLEKVVLQHFFANTLTKRRDDNAISRLWWNAHIANLAMPNTDLAGLRPLLHTADIRLNFVERRLTTSRVPLATAILRLLNEEAWLTDQADNFRSFMRVLNRRGGGLVFEAMPESDVFSFIQECAQQAGLPK